MNFHTIIEKIKNKHGIEFGGPTELFWNNQFGMPLYDNVTLDGGNLISDNHFQHKFSEKYEYSNKVGLQFDVDCAGDVSKINKKYDFVVTSHVIEHIANPIKAIKNWSKLLLNSDGYVLSIIPHYSYCFDRIRPLTTINHLISDFENNVTEDDTTHVDEQKILHDWSMGGHPDFYKLCEINHKTRVVHHHTFTPHTVHELFKICGLTPIATFKHDNLNIVNLSQI